MWSSLRVFLNILHTIVNLKLDAEMQGFIAKLKKKWGIPDTGALITILIIFTFAGPCTVFIANIAYGYLGFGPDTSIVYKIAARIMMFFPFHQVFLLFFGLLFGQFRFFWEKDKAAGRWIWSKVYVTNRRNFTRSTGGK